MKFSELPYYFQSGPSRKIRSGLAWVTLVLVSVFGTAPSIYAHLQTIPGGQKKTNGRVIVIAKPTTGGDSLPTKVDLPSIKAGSDEFELDIIYPVRPFQNTDKIFWNGVERPTTFVSRGKLSTRISATDVALPGTRTVALVRFSSDGRRETYFSTLFFVTPPQPVLDFDGDGATDITIVRFGIGKGAKGVWHVGQSALLRSNWSMLFWSQQFSQRGDISVPGDYDGDTRADLAVFRPSNGTWYILPSSAGYRNHKDGMTLGFSHDTDIPVPGDYDGDGKTDIAVFRPDNGSWYVQGSTRGPLVQQFGQSGDKPVVGDYDGDGKTDFAVFRPGEGTWYLLQSHDGFRALRPSWGWNEGDIPVPGR